MEYLISAFWILLELLSIFLFSAAFLNQKRSRKMIIIVIVITFLVVYAITYLNIPQSIRVIATLAVYFTATYYLFSGSLWIHLFLVFINCLFIGIMDVVVCYGMSALMGISMSELMWRKISYTAIGTIGKLLLIFIDWLLFRIRSTKPFNHINNKWFALTILFPLVSFLIVASFFYNSQSDEDISANVVLIGSILAIANIAVLYLVYALEKATAQEQEMLLMKQQMELQAQNILSLEKNYRIQRKASHEFEHHLLTLKDLLARSDMGSASDYLRKLLNDRASHLVVVNSHHPIIDVILNEKYRAAQEQSVNMQLRVNDLSGVVIAADQLVVLLSNLLDNALEAACKCDGRKEIDCVILSEKGLYISVRNTSAPVETVNGEIKTGKSDKQNHGFGLRSVKYILNALNAEYVFDYSDGWFQFAAEIPM